MSEEKVNNVGSSLAGYAIFPAAMVGGQSIAFAKRNGKDTLRNLKLEDFKNLDIKLQETHKDVFSRRNAIKENFEEYKKLNKKYYKYKKAVEKGKTPLLDKIANVFRSKEKQVNPITAAENAEKALKAAEESLEKGEQIASVAEKTAELTTAKKTLLNTIKSEVKNPLVLLFTALEAIPEITGKVIPAFQSGDTAEGFKQLGKTALNVGGSYASMTVGSAVGTMLGTAIIPIPGVGSAIGGLIGGIAGFTIGDMLKSKAISAITGEKEGEEEVENEVEQPQVVSEAQEVRLDENQAQQLKDYASQLTPQQQQELAKSLRKLNLSA